MEIAVFIEDLKFQEDIVDLHAKLKLKKKKIKINFSFILLNDKWCTRLARRCVGMLWCDYITRIWHTYKNLTYWRYTSEQAKHTRN